MKLAHDRHGGAGPGTLGMRMGARNRRSSSLSSCSGGYRCSFPARREDSLGSLKLPRFR